MSKRYLNALSGYLDEGRTCYIGASVSTVASPARLILQLTENFLPTVAYAANLTVASWPAPVYKPLDKSIKGDSVFCCDNARYEFYRQWMFGGPNVCREGRESSPIP